MLALIVASPFFVQAQAIYNQDSLDNYLSNHSDLETQLLYLEEKSWELRQASPDMAFLLARKGLGIAQKEENQVYQKKFLSRIGSIYFGRQTYDSAVVFMKQSLEVAEKIGNLSSQADILFNLSIYQEFQGDYPAALQSILKALTIYKQFDQLPKLMKAYQRLAEVNVAAERIPEAIQAYEKGLELAVHAKDTGSIIGQLQSIGTLLVGEAQKEGSSREQGIQLLDSALQLSLQSGEEKYLQPIFSNLGLAYARKGDCETALPYYEKVLSPSLSHAPFPLSYKISTEENYSRCLLELGRFKEAKKWAQLALEDAESLKNPKLLQSLYELHAGIEEKEGNFEQALVYQKLQADLAEVLRNEAREKEISVLQKDHELEKSQLEVEKAQEKQKKSRNGMLALLGGIVALILGGWILIQNILKEQREREGHLIEQAEKERKELLDSFRKQELNSLQAVIEGQEVERRRIAAELHDGLGGTMAALKMTFSSIQNKLDSEHPQKNTFSNAMNLLENAVHDVRQLSHQMAAKPLLHTNLKTAIQELTSSLQKNDIFQLKLTLDDLDKIELSPEHQLQLFRIIQEHLQNTLKHAKASEVSINIQGRNAWLTLEYMDNGKGFSYTEGDPLPGMGLQNIERRVVQMQGRWSLQTSKGKGIRSLVEIPLIRAYKSS